MNASNYQPQSLWLELGCEPLPVGGMARWLNQWTQAIVKELQDAGYVTPPPELFYSAFRLAWWFPDCRPQERREALRGPGASVALTPEGQWSLAAWAWAQRHGATPDEAEWRDDPKRSERVLWLCRAQPPLELSAQLGEVLASALRSVELPSQMSWEAGGRSWSFLRPIRRCAALWGEKPLQGQAFGLAWKSTPGVVLDGLWQEGEPLESPRNYSHRLLSRYGLSVEPEARRQGLAQALQEAAASVGGKLVEAPALLEKVSQTFESFRLLLGPLSPQVMTLPWSALRRHLQEEMSAFCLQSPSGEPLPYFLVVVQNLRADPDKLVQGYGAVIHARLNDLQFFYNRDLKASWEIWSLELPRLTIHPRLGHMADKVERLKIWVVKLAEALGCEAVTELKRAAALCKCDLSSQVVQEIPSLAGSMGAHYARIWGEKESLIAILEGTSPLLTSDAPLPQSEAACILALADKLDDVVGMVGAGLAPSGAKDPFGVKRACLFVARLLVEREWPLDLHLLVQWGEALYPPHALLGTAVSQSMACILQRLRSWWEHQGYESAHLEAVVPQETQLHRMHLKLNALQCFTQSLPEVWERLQLGFKRLLGMLKLYPESAGESLAWESLKTQALPHPAFGQLLAHGESLKSHWSLEPLSEARCFEHWKKIAEILPLWESLFDTVYFGHETPERLRLWQALFFHLQQCWEQGGRLAPLAYQIRVGQASSSR